MGARRRFAALRPKRRLTNPWADSARGTRRRPTIASRKARATASGDRRPDRTSPATSLGGLLLSSGANPDGVQTSRSSTSGGGTVTGGGRGHEAASERRSVADDGNVAAPRSTRYA